MPRPIRYALVATALILGALVWPEAPPDDRLAHAADRLQERAIAASAELDALCRDIPSRLGPDSATNWRTISALREELARTGTELLVRWQGTRYWTSSLPLDEHVLDTAVAAQVRSGSSVYLLSGALSKQGSVHALRLLWYQPPFENRYLHKHFHASLDVADGVEASVEPGLGPVVRDAQGAVLFRLQWAGDSAPAGATAWLRLILLLAGAALLFTALWSWFSTYASRGHARWSIAAMVLVTVMIRWWSLATAPWPVFSGFDLFEPGLFAASVLLPSLGDLLINVALLVLLCAFIRRLLTLMPPVGPPYLFVTIGLAGLLGFAAWTNSVMVALVRDSRIPLDLFHAQSLDGTSVVALFAIALLLFAWMLLADGFVRRASRSMAPRTFFLFLVAAFALAHLAYHLLDNFDSVLVLWPLPLLVALVWKIHGGSRFPTALVVVISLSLLTVHVLNRQTFKRIERDREALAESAATHEDPLVEWLFREARNAIAHDVETVTLLNDTARISASDLDTRVRQRFFQGNWSNYDVRLHLFGPAGQPRGSTSSGAGPGLLELGARFEQGVPVEGDNALRNVHRPTENALYLGAIGQEDAIGRGRLIVELLPRVLPEGLGFPELLMAGDRAVDRRSDRYARARYERGVLVESTGAFAFPTRWDRSSPPEASLSQQNGYQLLASGSVNGTLVVIGSAVPTWLDHVTTFSYVFLFFALLTSAFLLVRSSAGGRALPLFEVSTKLRTGILLFAGIAIALFAFGTQRLLSENYAAHVTEHLDERSRSAVTDLRQYVRADAEIKPDMRRDLDHWIDRASNILLTDIAAYATGGELIATSREQVFSTGLLGTRMDPDAYTAMAIDQRSVFSHEEHIGDAVFQATYRPLLNERGDVLAYLSMPYFARQSEVDDERTAGYVAIVNLFVLLFLLSLVAAALIANWTTLPLRSLKRGLERIQLGAHNEPLPYQGNDELGELVRVYNRKVDELRESAEKLARSERESAWKEMARQVAHEIKNPLTPMKLGIQHFQQTWDPNAADAKARLDRFTTSMVEQIDALSRVASDFSRFAEMSAANETVLDLSEVAKSAVALFAGEPNADITLYATSPLMVKADREHLLRVFNNLIKNATQAIPEGRRGDIRVSLRTDADQAVVEIRDNGAGIPEEVREHIFEPSFTTKSSGMGLGLALVKRMVEQAGGSVHFIAHPGEGTSFFVSLPLLK